MKQSNVTKLTTVLLFLFFSLQLAALPHSSDIHEEHDALVHDKKNNYSVLQAVQIAIENSPQLKTAHAQYEASKGAVEQSEKWLNPELGLEMENFGGSGDFKDTNAAEYTATISQKVELLGKRKTRVAVAKSQREQKSIWGLIEKNNVIHATELAYIGVLFELEKVAVAAEQIELEKKLLDSIKKRINLAVEPEFQLNKTIASYKFALANKQKHEHLLEVAKSKLASVMGISEINFLLEHSYLFQLEEPKPYKEYEEKLDQSLEIKLISNLINEKKHNLKFEKSKRIPDPSVAVGFRHHSDSRDNALVAKLNLEIPIFSLNGGNIKTARAKLEESMHKKDDLLFTKRQDLVRLWHDWNFAYIEAKQHQVEILPNLRKALDLSFEGYKVGRFSILDILDTQKRFVESKDRYYQALHNYHTARINLHRLMSNVEYIKE